MWTLVGAGIKTTEQSRRRQKQCIPNGTTWLQTSIEGFDPEENSVSLHGAYKDKKARNFSVFSRKASKNNIRTYKSL